MGDNRRFKIFFVGSWLTVDVEQLPRYIKVPLVDELESCQQLKEPSLQRLLLLVSYRDTSSLLFSNLIIVDNRWLLTEGLLYNNSQWFIIRIVG